jgi:hypothetical protein
MTMIVDLPRCYDCHQSICLSRLMLEEVHVRGRLVSICWGDIVIAEVRARKRAALSVSLTVSEVHARGRLDRLSDSPCIIGLASSPYFRSLWSRIIQQFRRRYNTNENCASFVWLPLRCSCLRITAPFFCM